MSLGLVGRKVGMTRVFAEDGSSIPVTVVDVSNNRVTQIKTPDTDGYAAVQVTFGKRRASRVNRAAAGHLAKAGVEAGEVFKEFRVGVDQLAGVLGLARLGDLEGGRLHGAVVGAGRQGRRNLDIVRESRHDVFLLIVMLVLSIEALSAVVQGARLFVSTALLYHPRIKQRCGLCLQITKFVLIFQLIADQ